MNKTKETINIFFSTAGGYEKYIDVAITSIIENASKDYNYKITILNCDSTEENKKILQKHNNENFSIVFRDVQWELNRLKALLPNSFIFSIASYFRFFIETLYPDLDKAIYLDGDVIVVGDISKLYEIDLGDNLLGAVNEQNCFLMPLMTAYTEQVSGIDPHKFFNSGVLLMNLKEIRKLGVLNKFIELVKKYNFETPMADQDYLNNICRNRVKLLPNCWNKESVESQKLEGELQIRHYAFGIKPWKTMHLENADLFWKYAEKSHFYEQIKKEFESVTEQDLLKDRENAGKLIAMAERLLQSDHTFKKLIIDVEDK